MTSIAANSDDANPVVTVADYYSRTRTRWQIGIDSVAVTGTVVLEGIPRASTEYKQLVTFDLSDATLRFGIVDGDYSAFRADHAGLAADTDYTLHLDPLG